MGIDKHERNHRDGRKAPVQKPKHLGPPKDQQWCWFSRDFVNSDAFRALSKNAYKVIFRVVEEHMAHGGTENGNLLVTHEQFGEYGIRLASVAKAIREAEFYGFIGVDRGFAYKGSHEPNIYRLTWMGDKFGAPPTNEWKGIESKHISVWKERERLANLHASEKRRKKKTAKVVPLVAV